MAITSSGFDIKTPDGKTVLSILTPFYAVLATQDLISALNDHRDGEWACEDEKRYGLDRCIVFATTPEWMGGWAFDTRIQDQADETVIRPTFDFSADDSAMQEHWQENPVGEVTLFEDWLRDRVDELVG